MSSMRVDPRFLRWGVFFVLLGAVPLAVQQGWVSADALSGYWRFWPLILIGIGVGLLLRRTPFHFVGGLIVAATFGLLFGSLLATGVNGGVGFGCVSDRSGTAFASSTGAFAGDVHVDIEMTCGDLDVSTGSGGNWTVSRELLERPDTRHERTVRPAGAACPRSFLVGAVREPEGRGLEGRPADRADDLAQLDAQCRDRPARLGQRPRA